MTEIAVEKLSILGLNVEDMRAGLQCLVQARADRGWTMRGISPVLTSNSILVVFERKKTS